ncbi:MAG: hypothetical protein QW607_03465 [Desulfurococcaceae archaeon]
MFCRSIVFLSRVKQEPIIASTMDIIFIPIYGQLLAELFTVLVYFILLYHLLVYCIGSVKQYL